MIAQNRPALTWVDVRTTVDLLVAVSPGDRNDWQNVRGFRLLFRLFSAASLRIVRIRRLLFLLLLVFAFADLNLHLIARILVRLEEQAEPNVVGVGGELPNDGVSCE